MKEKQLTLRVVKGKYSVCRLHPTQTIPQWCQHSEFYAITKTPTELSIVCESACVPNGVKSEDNWSLLMLEGPLDFSLIGILASLSQTLAKAGISIFAVSTYDTDYILIKESKLPQAIDALSHEGYTVLQ